MKKYDQMFDLTDRKVAVMGGEAAIAVLKPDYEEEISALVYPDGLREALAKMPIEEQVKCLKLIDSFDYGLAGKASLEQECVILDAATVKGAFGRGSIIRTLIEEVLVTEGGTLIGVRAYGKVVFLGGEIAYETTLTSSDENNGAGYKPGGDYTGTKYLTLLYLPSLLFNDVIYQTEKNREIVELVVEEGVVKISGNAFSECEKLRSVTLPEGLIEIGYKAFSECKNLEYVRIPASVKSIGPSAFSACESLREVVFLGACPIDNAFADCTALERVVLAGEGEYELGSFAFNNCKSLVEVVGSEKITKLGEYAFSGCESLREITLSEKVLSILTGTFGGCKSLVRLELPKSVSSIGSYAFSRCESLEEVILPGKLWYIVKNAFLSCHALRKITVSSDMLDEVRDSLDDEVRDLVEFITV